MEPIENLEVHPQIKLLSKPSYDFYDVNADASKYIDVVCNHKFFTLLSDIDQVTDEFGCQHVQIALKSTAVGFFAIAFEAQSVMSTVTVFFTEFKAKYVTILDQPASNFVKNSKKAV
jgi:hypothetical protein